MRDTLPKKVKSIECGIINLDRSVNQGTHWVAYAKIYDYCTYFDSFGNLKPPIEFTKYVKNCEIYYNYDRLQNFNTVICGHLCLRFLKHFWNKYLK